MSEHLVRILRSPEDFERFQRFLEGLFYYGRDIFNAVIGKIDDLHSANAALNCRYRNLSLQEKKLFQKVISYIELVSSPPSCSESRTRAILEELTDEHDTARLDLADDERFPNTVDFLRELAGWLESANEAYREVNELYSVVHKEAVDVVARTETIEYEAGKRRKIADGAAITSLMGAGAGGLLIAGGAALTGGLLLPAGGIAALWCYLASGSFKEQELQSRKTKEQCENLHRRAAQMTNTATSVESQRHGVALRNHVRAVKRPRPMLTYMTESFESIFELLRNSSNFDREKERVRNIIMNPP